MVMTAQFNFVVKKRVKQQKSRFLFFASSAQVYNSLIQCNLLGLVGALYIIACAAQKKAGKLKPNYFASKVSCQIVNSKI